MSKLKDADGSFVDWNSGLPQLIVDYFLALFHSSLGYVQPIIDCGKPVVLNEQNTHLLSPYTKDEVKKKLSFLCIQIKVKILMALIRAFFKAFGVLWGMICVEYVCSV